MDRRELLRRTLRVGLWVALARTLALPRVLAAPVAEPFAAWAREIESVSLDLREHVLGPERWQDAIEALLTRVPPDELLRAIDFEALEARLDYPDLGVDTVPVRLPGLDAGGARRAFHSKVFGMEEDRAIIPHGHRNMASAHLVLGGALHLRQYERIGTDGDAWVVRPTVDERVATGHVSSISDERNNVHWLVARGGRAWTLDVIVTGIDPEDDDYAIANLDADGAEALPGGDLRMRTLSVDEALRRYGHSHHG